MFIAPQWPALKHIHAFTTTRRGGFSQPPYDTFNLAHHVGDDPVAVDKNRRHLVETLSLPQEPIWLEQIHSAKVICAENHTAREADATISFVPGQVCVVLTADCLPILLCDEAGSCIAAIHAGWRGLQRNIIHATIHALNKPSATLLAWLGPAIGPTTFEVGEDVLLAFSDHGIDISAIFTPTQPGKWLANLYQLAMALLRQAGVTAIYTPATPLCTYRQSEDFFSYRRQHPTGRMASLIWMSSR